MKVLDVKRDKGIMYAAIEIEKAEFDKELKEAYLDNAGKFIVPGFAAGLAPVGEVEKLYGEEALREDAMARAVPDAFNKFKAQEHIRIIGKPEAADITPMPDGGVAFRVRAALYPTVKLGCYKGISVPSEAAKDDEDFKIAVLRSACEKMECEMPDVMVEQKLDSLVAQEKLTICNDPVYHLLADTAFVLTGAYHAAGIARSPAQVNAEALDIMLQTASGGNKNPSKEFMASKILSLVERYRTPTENFDMILDGIFSDRISQKRKMSPEELAGEAFNAYLGSIEHSESSWRAEHRESAVESARCDLLLEAVAEKENITATDSDMEEMISRIASHCGMEPDEVMAGVDPVPIRMQIIRDKACRFIMDNAVKKD